MLEITVRIEGEMTDAQGIKEKLATDLERYGDVRVVKVLEIKPEEIKLKGF